MEITLYSFNKRNNSTKRPTGGTVVTGEIKETSSILTPTISFGAVQPEYNYAYIPSFSRYYWIRDWTYSGGLWVASMEVDVLASWKDVIGASRQFIVRSSAEYDTDVIDSMYPAKNNAVTEIVESVQPFDPVNPVYVVGVLGKGGTHGGMITYYALSYQEFRELSKYLLSETEYMGTDFGTFTSDFIKQDFNPIQYITGIYKMPYEPIKSNGESPIYFGWWTLGLTAHRALSMQRVFLNFDVPKHPQQSRGAYLNGPPYSTYTLNIPPFGSIPLDGNILSDSKTLKCAIYIDVPSNMCQLIVKNENDYLLAISSETFGASMQIGQVGTSKLNQIGAAASIAGAIFTGDVGDGISGAVDALKSVFPQVQMKGASDSLVQYQSKPTLYAKFMPVTEEDNADIGKPLYKPRTISTIPGYVQTRNADIAAPATAEEIGKIENELNGGIFYE